MAKVSLNKVIIIVIASLCLGTIYNYFSQAGVPLFGFSMKKHVTAEMTAKENEVPLSEPKVISLKEALKFHEANVIFIDARANEDFLKGHIKNAINVPFYEFDKYKENLRGISKDEPIVCYCEGAECDLSDMLGEKLASMGYKMVFIFFGGWYAWSDAKFPIAK
ncbi:MAG TPA: rhodanese-like domain-containing protein [Ignavibacteriales bacterium]|nr:rhodanese-like domain-containing protein [Ignavibacteriales bacterium]